MATLQLLVERMTVGPVMPATILVGLLVMYTLVAIVGLVDFDLDMPDVDLDLDLDGGVDSIDLDLAHGIGGAALRWVNFGRVPIVIWAGIFTVAFWSFSYTLWHHFDVDRYEPTLVTSAWLVARNAVLAILATKFFTSPMIKYFAPLPQYTSQRLIGATCEVVSYQATSDEGQAKFRTDAAPLLLNIRTLDQQRFVKGDEVRIVAYQSSNRTYQVTSLSPESIS